MLTTERLLADSDDYEVKEDMNLAGALRLDTDDIRNAISTEWWLHDMFVLWEKCTAVDWYKL